MNLSIPSSRKLAAPVIVIATALLLACLPAAAGAACGGHKSPVVLNGKTVCLKTAKPKVVPGARTSGFALSNWIKQTIAPVSIKKNGGYRKLKNANAFKRALPKVARAATKFAARIDARKFHARAARRARSRNAFAAGAGPVVDRMTVSNTPIDLGNGVTLTETADALAYADDHVEVEVAMVVKKGNESVRLTPKLDWNSRYPEAQCPTADGTVTIDYTDEVGGTMVAMRGRKVLGAVTEKTTFISHARGHVGRDAKLHSVDADVTMKIEHYERGLQLNATYTSSATISREGDPTPGANPSATMSIRAAGATAKQERAFNAQYAATLAANQDRAAQVGTKTELARWRMLKDEYKWFNIPNSCADTVYDPQTIASLAHGASKTVRGTVKAANGGGEAAAQFTVNDVARGGFAATKALSDPGNPAKFEAKGADPDSDPSTVEAKAIVSSTAGRADASFYAQDDGGVDVIFAGTATYLRDEGNSGTTSQHHVTATYDWSISYRNVSLSADSGYLNFPAANSFTGTWNDQGRYGTPGPGDFNCGGPLKSYSGEYATLTVEKTALGYKVKAAPFFMVQYDIANLACTGLGGPPYATYNAFGSAVAQQAHVEFANDDIANGPVIKSASPPTTLAADCSDMIVSHGSPCNQLLNWSGKVSIKRAGTPNP